MKNQRSLSILFKVFMVVCPFLISPAHAYVFTQENPNPGDGSIFLSYNAFESQGTTLAVDVKGNTLSDTSPAFGTAFDLDFDSSLLTYVSFSPGKFFERTDITDPNTGNGS